MADAFPPFDRSSLTTSADAALARRLESFAARDVAGLAEAAATLFPETGARFIEVAGGIAGYLGTRSPANGAVGLGFDGAVTHEHVASIERFFLDRGEEPVVSVCPLAHDSLAAVLSERGWTAGTCENVLVRTIDPRATFESRTTGVEVREATGEADVDAWALLAAHGFAAPGGPTEAELRLSKAATRREDAQFFFGLVDGEYAGTGQLEIDGDMAWLSGDATLPRFRRRGVQSSLQRARLEIARQAGCLLAVTESVPGSPSQRNMERAGFRVAYTRVDAWHPVSRSASPPRGAAE